MPGVVAAERAAKFIKAAMTRQWAREARVRTLAVSETSRSTNEISAPRRSQGGRDSRHHQDYHQVVAEPLLLISLLASAAEARAV